MLGSYKDAVCRTVFSESSCRDAVTGRAARVQNPLSVGPRDLSASWALGGGTPTPAHSHTGHCPLVVPWCGFLHLSLKQRERTWQLLFSDCSGKLVCEYRWSCFLFFLPCCVTCGILVPWPGIEPGPSAVRVQNLNHWTAREFSRCFSLDIGMGWGDRLRGIVIWV